MRKKNISIEPEYVEIPNDIIERNKMVTLLADVMLVNKSSFIITYGHGVGLIMVEYIPNRTAKQLAINLTTMVKLYAHAGYIVRTLLKDMEFEKIRGLLPQVNVNISATNGHVAEVERRIRTDPAHIYHNRFS